MITNGCTIVSFGIFSVLFVFIFTCIGLQYMHGQYMESLIKRIDRQSEIYSDSVKKEIVYRFMDEWREEDSRKIRREYEECDY